MISHEQTNNEAVRAARESFYGRGLKETQFEMAWAVASILRSEIQNRGTFNDLLTDHAHVFSRNEKFDAARGEAIIRGVFKGRYAETPNQMRERYANREEAITEQDRTLALSAAESVPAMIQEGQTRPFYQAQDAAAVTLSMELGITRNGAKALMKDAYQAEHNRDLYEVGKEVEEAYHKPVREAEIAARKAEKLQTYNRSQSMG